MLLVISHDRLLLPILQPRVARNLAVVLVDFAEPLAPVVELADAQLQPGEELLYGQLRAFGPASHVVDDLVADVVGNPASF
jgi:hypothetical protein